MQSKEVCAFLFWDYDWIEKLCFTLTSAKWRRRCQSKVFVDLAEDPCSIPRMHTEAHNHLCLFSGDPEPSSSLCGHQYIAAVYALMKEKIKIKINKVSDNYNKKCIFVYFLYLQLHYAVWWEHQDLKEENRRMPWYARVPTALMQDTDGVTQCPQTSIEYSTESSVLKVSNFCCFMQYSIRISRSQ